MNSLLRRCILTLVALATLGVRLAVAAPAAPLKLPEFESLAAKASESVNVSLDSSLLGLAAGFLDPKDPEDAAAKQLIAGLKGIYVRDRKSTRLNSSHSQNLGCRLLLDNKKGRQLRYSRPG